MPTPVVGRTRGRAAGAGERGHEVEEPMEQRLVRVVKWGREVEVRSLLLSLGKREVWRAVCAADAEGKTAVHWACQYGHLPALCLLLAALPPHPAPVHAPVAADSLSPHHQLSLHRHPDVSSAGGDPRDVIHSDVIQHVGPNLCDVIPVHSEVTHSADRVQPGTDTTSVINPDPGSEGSCSNNDCMRCSVLNARDSRGQTPLLAACNFRQTDIAAFLVTLPCCRLQARDPAGNTVLHRAIHHGLDTLACLLCQAHADVCATNRQRLTPLHEAVRTGSHDVMRALIRHGCDVNARSSSKAAPTPFLTAIFYCRISPRGKRFDVDGTLRLLVQAGCRLSEGDSQWTPLAATIDTDNSHIAALLLYHGCQIPKQQASRSVLVEAFAKCTPLVVTLLVACGYQPSREDVEQCARRIPAFSPLFYRICTTQRAAMKAKVTLLDWLRQRAVHPPSLLELSRGAVRAALNRAAGDASILLRIPSLPLPHPLLHFVSLRQLVPTSDLEL